MMSERKLKWQALAANVLTGDAFEVRNLAALSIRSMIWIVVALFASHTVRQASVGSSQP